MLKKIVSTLGNVKLGVGYLIALALLSVLGSTYIKQGETYITYYKEYGEFFAKVIWMTYLNNVFHAWYYQLLIVLVAVAVIAATVDRFPSIYKTAYGKVEKKMTEGIQKKPSTIMISTQEDSKTVFDKMVSFLQDIGFKKAQVISENSGEVYIYAEKGRESRLGMLVTHIGIVVFLVGAFIGSVLGVRGQIEIPESEKVDYIKKYREGSLVPGDEIYKLPFEIYVKRFWLDFYDSKEFAGSVKSYNSDIDIIENGKVVKNGIVKVNEPIDYNRYRIFQTSYGKTGEMKEADIVVVEYKKLIDIIERSQILNNQLAQAKDSPKSVEIEKQLRDLQRQTVEFFNNGKRIKYRFGEEGITFENNKFTVINQTLNYKNPALVQQDVYDPLLIVKVSYNGKEFNMPIAADPNVGIAAYERFVKPYNFPYIMFIEKFEPRYFTGLQVSYFPGTTLIWIGTVIVVLGTMLAFYTVHRRVWIKILDNGQNREVHIASYSQKFKESFEEKIKETIKSYL
ncbi:MAG: cytochrome c biogenesis protein ResB [Hydrogenothermaceae bacterium]